MHIDVIYHVVYTTTLWMLRGAHETLAASACVRNRVCLSVLMFRTHSHACMCAMCVMVSMGTHVCGHMCVCVCVCVCVRV